MSSSSHIRCVSNLEIVVELCLLFYSAVNYQSLFQVKEVKVAFFKKILSLVITLNKDDQLKSK